MEYVPQDRARERIRPLPDSSQVWGKPRPEDKTKINKQGSFADANRGNGKSIKFQKTRLLASKKTGNSPPIEKN
jgi:hypothetical protein